MPTPNIDTKVESETRIWITAREIARRYTREGTGYADRLYQLTYAIDEALRNERERYAKVADDTADKYVETARYAAASIARAIREGR